jgi:hypothetical protein
MQAFLCSCGVSQIPAQNDLSTFGKPARFARIFFGVRGPLLQIPRFSSVAELAQLLPRASNLKKIPREFCTEIWLTPH